MKRMRPLMVLKYYACSLVESMKGKRLSKIFYLNIQKNGLTEDRVNLLESEIEAQAE